MSHTSGQWKVMPGTSAPRICVDGDKDWPIVVTISGHSPEGIEANERLIAAAPDMLKTLERFQRLMANLMAKGNVPWGQTFGVDFGLMNESLIMMDRTIEVAKGLKAAKRVE